MQFKFSNLKTFCIWIICVIFLFSGFSVVAWARGEVGSALLILSIFVPLSILGGFFGIISTMNIVVSENGISRNFLNHVWQNIDWDNCKSIKLFYMQDRRSGKITCFNIFPKILPRFRIIPSGKISFNNQMGEFQEFKELFNKYIKKYGIKVERVDSGVSVFIDSI